ncbi:MAG TPA: hypothetical protein VJG32_11045 [Anaerolineae bacterium]|nr:hypothetical protein [Anaerolineae bacterium]
MRRFGFGPAQTLILVSALVSSALAGCSMPAPDSLQDDVRPGQQWFRRTIGGGGGQTGIAIDPSNPEVVYVTTDNGGIVKTIDGGASWLSINNNIGNRLLGDIEMDPLNPSVLYVVAEVYSENLSWNDDPVNGELYRTRDGGESWEIVYAEGMGGGDGRAFGIVQWPSTRNILIPYDSNNPRRYDADDDRLSDVIYIGGWDWDASSADKRAGIWKSLDEGATFAQVALPDQNIWVLRHHPNDPERLYAGTYGDGLFVSADGGAAWESWRDRLPIPLISDLAIVPDSSTLYVATNGFRTEYAGEAYRDRRGIFKSVDGGSSFFRVNSGLERTSLNFEVLLLDATDSTGQTLYTGPWRGDYQGVYQTTDGAASWAPMTHEIREDPYWFDDFNNLWVLEQANDGRLFATTWRGIYRYEVERGRWAITANGLGNVGVRQVMFEPGSDSVIYLGMLDSTPWKSLDKGKTWINIGNGFKTADGSRNASASSFAISPAQPQVVYAAGIGSSGSYLSAVNKSTNGGAYWTPITNGLPPTTAEAPQWQAQDIVVTAYDPAIAYLALDLRSNGGRVYKTVDGGQHWSEVHAFAESPTDLAITATDPETVVAATANGSILVGRQGGSQWRSSHLGMGMIYAVDVFPSDPDRILLGVNVTGAYLTTDGGQTWEQVFDQRDLQPFISDLALSDFARERYRPTIRAVRFDPRDPDTLYIGHYPDRWMGIGILKSTDAGQGWTLLADKGWQMRSVSDFDLHPASGNLVVGTWEIYYYYQLDPE